MLKAAQSIEMALNGINLSCLVYVDKINIKSHQAKQVFDFTYVHKPFLNSRPYDIDFCKTVRAHLKGMKLRNDYMNGSGKSRSLTSPAFTSAVEHQKIFFLKYKTILRGIRLLFMVCEFTEQRGKQWFNLYVCGKKQSTRKNIMTIGDYRANTK